ncbi:MAG: Coenzyme F420 hydrogenase/dehydrogenase, beta subunit C-terminal domain [Bacteroidaceae bacterium]
MINILEKRMCVGCNACAQCCPKQCITLQEDNEGFLYPHIDDEKCIDCGLCEKVCPVLNQGDKHEPLAVYAAKNNNDEIRMASSSGGIFTFLAEQILSESGVVFGARFNDDWEVIHDYTETIEGLTAFRGSKYVQSRIGSTYLQAEQYLKAGRKVMFSGTPCQIAGLRLFLRKEYDNLLCVDLVCHGVPSPKVWRMYLEEIIAREGVIGKNTVSSHPLKERKTITNIQFRNKSTGWKKFSFALTLSEPLGKEKNSVLLSETVDKNIFMRGFLRNLYLRPSCYDCPSKCFKSGSDITIGDYWGISTDLDDDKGVSLVLINTWKGTTLYSKLNVNSVKTTYTQAVAGNSCIEQSVEIPYYRTLFWEEYKAVGIDAIALIYRKMSPTLINQSIGLAKRIVKQIIGRK